MEESLPTIVIVAFYDAAGLVTVSKCVCVLWSLMCHVYC